MKVGVTFGAWDLLHPGHVAFLQECKLKSDRLIVGLHFNPAFEREDIKNPPVETVFERFIRLAGVLRDRNDSIVPYETEFDLINILAIYDINVRFIGSDYKTSPWGITGQAMMDLKNIKMEYIDRLHNWSSTSLRLRQKANGSYVD